MFTAFEKMKMKRNIAYQIYHIDGAKIEVDEELSKADAGAPEEYVEKFIQALKDKGISIFD